MVLSFFSISWPELGYRMLKTYLAKYVAAKKSPHSTSMVSFKEDERTLASKEIVIYEETRSEEVTRVAEGYESVAQEEEEVTAVTLAPALHPSSIKRKGIPSAALSLVICEPARTLTRSTTAKKEPTEKTLKETVPSVVLEPSPKRARVEVETPSRPRAKPAAKRCTRHHC